jgi:hypothetical protein
LFTFIDSLKDGYEASAAFAVKRISTLILAFLNALNITHMEPKPTVWEGIREDHPRKSSCFPSAIAEKAKSIEGAWFGSALRIPIFTQRIIEISTRCVFL